MEDLIFVDNIASYGPNVGSYPNQIQIVDDNGEIISNLYLWDIASGQIYNSSIHVILIDHEG